MRSPIRTKQSERQYIFSVEQIEIALLVAATAVSLDGQTGGEPDEIRFEHSVDDIVKLLVR